MVEKLHNVFAYGSLKESDVRHRVIGRKVPTIDDAVSGYSTVEINIGGKPYSAAVKGWGVLNGKVFSVTEQELELLDAYEIPEYERVEILTIKEERAFMYVKKEQ